MNLHEEDTFQSSSKFVAIQTVPVGQDSHYPSKTHQSATKKKQNVGWKFTTISNPTQSSIHNAQYKKHHRNISFKQERCYTDYKSEIFVTEETQQQIHQSSLFQHYQNHTEVYRKKYDFGTSWIGKHHYFASIFVNPETFAAKRLKFQLQRQSPEQDKMNSELACSFDSEFESGNLFAVYKVGNYEYDLILQNDFNTKGNTQWFYFRVRNFPKNKNIKINIINLQKTDSLFNYGMKPCIFSMVQWSKTKKGWMRGGSHIRYFRNSNLVQNTNKYYYTLSFVISTPHQQDVLRIAQNYPYTTLDLQNYLQSLRKFKPKNELIQQQSIATTLGSNKIYCITVKQPSKKIIQTKNKPLILVLARQHPGETVSSFVCQGILDFLTTNTKQSQFLRKNYEIKIIPMANPDGVVVGNYRTNLFGYDLNRKWQGKKTKLPQQSYLMKKFITQAAANRKIAFVLDLHGHSRKIFSFFYGNPCDISSVDSKIFPYLCSKLSPNYIKFQDCLFSSDLSKRNTARVQLNLSFKCQNIFTFETSFYGYIDKNGIKKHFTTDNYRELGSILCKAIYTHQKGRQQPKSILEIKQINLYSTAVNQLRTKKYVEKFKEQQESGSDSDPECYELSEGEEQRLLKNKRYAQSSISKIADPKKVTNQFRKSQILSKSPKQIKFLQIAQVSSIFPQNKMALLPDSYMNKKNPKKTASIQTQTQDTFDQYTAKTDAKKESSPFKSNQFNPFSSNLFSKTNASILSSILQKKIKENKFHSNKTFTSKDEAIGNILFKTNGFRSFSQRKEYETLKKQKEKIETKSRLASDKLTKEKAVQTDGDMKEQENNQSEIRNTATSQEKRSQVFDRKYITVYNQFKYHKQKSRSSRFSTINQLISGNIKQAK